MLRFRFLFLLVSFPVVASAADLTRVKDLYGLPEGGVWVTSNAVEAVYWESVSTATITTCSLYYAYLPVWNSGSPESAYVKYASNTTTAPFQFDCSLRGPDTWLFLYTIGQTTTGTEEAPLTPDLRLVYWPHQFTSIPRMAPEPSETPGPYNYVTTIPLDPYAFEFRFEWRRGGDIGSTVTAWGPQCWAEFTGLEIGARYYYRAQQRTRARVESAWSDWTSSRQVESSSLMFARRWAQYR